MSWGIADLWQFPEPTRSYIPSPLEPVLCASCEGVFPWGTEYQTHRLVHWTLWLFFDGIVFSFLSMSQSLLHFSISTAGHHSAYFIHIINTLHLCSSQSLMKMLNNSKPNTHPSGPTGHFPLISYITFHLSYVLWLQISCWFWICVTFHPVLFELISWVKNLRDVLPSVDSGPDLQRASLYSDFSP